MKLTPYERTETITYEQNIQDSGDLESATKTITAIAPPANPDYTTSLTIAAPSDTRLSVVRLSCQINVTIDSWAGGGTILYFQLYRNGVSCGAGPVATGGATGAQVVALDITSDTLTGQATYDVYLWVNTGSCTISVCRLYVGVGASNATSTSTVHCLKLTYDGWVTIGAAGARQGTGTFIISICHDMLGGTSGLIVNSSATSSPSLSHSVTIISSGSVGIGIRSATVSTDLCAVTKCLIKLSRVRS